MRASSSRTTAPTTSPLGANGTFTFATPIPSGGAYAVTVLTNPSSPSQTCVVTSGGGTVTSANITSVVVTCTTIPRGADDQQLRLTTTNSGRRTRDLRRRVRRELLLLVQPRNVDAGHRHLRPPFLSHNIFDGTYAYMSGWNSNVLYKLNGSTGAITTVTSSAPSGGFTLAFNNGVLYAANPWAGPTLLYKVNTTTGAFTTFATICTAGDAIDGIWSDPSGNVYMNGGANNVYKVTPAGVVSTFISNDGHLNTNTTQGISDLAGNIYIPSRNIAENRIKYNSAGTYQATLTTTCAPWGIAVASSGNLLYTCDTGIVYTLQPQHARQLHLRQPRRNPGVPVGRLLRERLRGVLDRNRRLEAVAGWRDPLDRKPPRRRGFCLLKSGLGVTNPEPAAPIASA